MAEGGHDRRRPQHLRRSRAALRPFRTPRGSSGSEGQAPFDEAQGKQGRPSQSGKGHPERPSGPRGVRSGSQRGSRGAAVGRHGAPATVFGRLPAAAIEQLERAGGSALTVLPAAVLPDARAVAELGRQRFESRGADDLAALRPIYLRKSYAEEAFDIDLRLR